MTPPISDTRGRLTFVAALLLSVLVVLVVRLWYIQIVGGERYAALAERNRVRTVSIEAPRGRVLDRAGRVLVDNRQVHVISVDTEEMGDRRDAVLADLARLLGVDEPRLRDRIAQAPDDPARPVPVAFDVPERIALFIWEQQSTRFPGVHADLVPRRSYPHGALAAHVLGYTGLVTREQLDQPEFAGVEPGTQVGMAGVERAHEHALRGSPGQRRLEIDATGEMVRQLSERLPEPGADVSLTIDLEAQRLAERALADGIARARAQTDTAPDRPKRRFAAPAGAVVVLDPRDGALRAVASYPTFEPEAFVGGIDADSYAALVDPPSHAPLINRAVQATYPPGSVFKVVAAAAALRHRFATPRTALPCPAVWRWGAGGQPLRNWTSADLGDLTLAESLTHSCDTVYYELAKRMWEAEEQRGRADDFVGQEARLFGYGTATGVDLPDERHGVVPGRRREGQDPAAPWRGGDAVNMAIGQGDLLATPLQVAASMAAIANAGVVPRPHVAMAVDDASGRGGIDVRPGTPIDLDPVALDAIRQGLVGVTAPGGTTADAFADSVATVAGKTGTAEAGSNQPFAWFAGYGPVTAPRHVVVVVVEQGGPGSGTAAPIAREIFDGLATADQRAAR